MFDAEANAFPITATSGDWTAPLSEIRVGQRVWDNNTLRVYAENNELQTYYVVELSRHDGQPITPGTYTDQKALVINKSLGCYDNTADFTVERLDIDAEGLLTAFDGAVEHRCGPEPDNALRVKVHFVRGDA
ncbi:hypothetical protein ACIA8G_39170 [Lentzea sp. NPDC051213]|uniref:hypothetical protein n=1 Tax=Lentzea sp. NPDC051213 TaxID=3364126 RepID=UPI0037929880